MSQAFEENNTRPFWKYVKSQRQDNLGVLPLKKDGKLNSDSKTKAEILLEEFKSVFTHKDTSHIPTLSGPSYPTLSNLNLIQCGKSYEASERMRS